MLELKKDGNIASIYGLLSEVDLEYKTFVDKKTNTEQKAIGGTIKILVEEEINGEKVEVVIPVQMFSTELKKDGNINPSYTNIEKIKQEFVSIAAGGKEKADGIHVKGDIRMNEYYKDPTTLISYPRIHASFANSIPRGSLRPGANFSVILFIGKAGYELDEEGVETDRYKIQGVLPKWGGSVDVVPFYANDETAANAMKNYWHEGETVLAEGKLYFTTVEEEIASKSESSWGETKTEIRSIRTNELLITGGSMDPLEGEAAYDAEEIKQGLALRQAALDKSKEKSANRAPMQTQKAGINDFGF